MPASNERTVDLKVTGSGNGPRLDERFITNIKGKEFVVYAGVLDLAHQKGLQKIEVDVVQYPTKENGSEAICKATIESKDGEIFVEWGDANPRNTNEKIVHHILRTAATRGKARALRDFTNIGMTCLEELGDFDEVIGPESGFKRSGNNRPPANQARKPVEEPPVKIVPPKQEDKAANQGNKAATQDKATEKPKTDGESKQQVPQKLSSAQLRAIENLSKRRGISPEELKGMLKEQYGTAALDTLTATEASSFIRSLQQSA
jgi:hypothetical protein